MVLSVAPDAHDLLVPVEFHPVEIFADGLMGLRLADKDEVAARSLHGGADRLAGEQIIAEIDRPQATDGRAVGDQPTLGRGMLAVLLVGTVLRDDKLRRQGQNAGMTGRHQSGTEKAVEILHLAIRPAAMRALRTMQLARAEMLGAVQGDQHPSTQTAERSQPICSLDCPTARSNSARKCSGATPSSICRM